MNIGVVTTSFPRHAGDYAGCFVGDRVSRLLADGHSVDVIAAGDGDVAREMEHRRLTVAPDRHHGTAFLRGGRARGAGARRPAGPGWRPRASRRRSPARSGRAPIASTSSSRTGWCRARSPRWPPRPTAASARSRIRATSRCWNGFRSAAPSPAAWSAQRSPSASSATSCGRASPRWRAPRWASASSRRWRSCRMNGRRGPGSTSSAGGSSASRARRSSRSDGWFRSRATTGCCAPARICGPRRPRS